MKIIKRFVHNLLGWGFPKENQGRIGGDDFQPTYQCQFCDYILAQDSTGSWFHLSSKIKTHKAPKG